MCINEKHKQYEESKQEYFNAFGEKMKNLYVDRCVKYYTDELYSKDVRYMYVREIHIHPMDNTVSFIGPSFDIWNTKNQGDARSYQSYTQLKMPLHRFNAENCMSYYITVIPKDKLLNEFNRMIEYCKRDIEYWTKGAKDDLINVSS